MNEFGYLVENIFSIVGNLTETTIEVLTHEVTIPDLGTFSVLSILTGGALVGLILFYIIKGLIK